MPERYEYVTPPSLGTKIQLFACVHRGIFVKTEKY